MTYLKVIMCKEWMIEAKIQFRKPFISSLNFQILILFVFWLPSWQIVKAIWVHFWPKSNLRIVLWLHRGPLGPQKCQNMLTTALFLMQDDVKHPVAVLMEGCNCKIQEKMDFCEGSNFWYFNWLYPCTKRAITLLSFEQIEKFQCLKSSTT